MAEVLAGCPEARVSQSALPADNEKDAKNSEATRRRDTASHIAPCQVSSRWQSLCPGSLFPLSYGDLPCFPSRTYLTIRYTLLRVPQRAVHIRVRACAVVLIRVELRVARRRVLGGVGDVGHDCCRLRCSRAQFLIEETISSFQEQTSAAALGRELV